MSYEKRTYDDGDERIACPHCGEMNIDLWDRCWADRESLETKCWECGKSFELRRGVSVSYVAVAIVEGEPALPGEGGVARSAGQP